MSSQGYSVFDYTSGKPPPSDPKEFESLCTDVLPIIQDHLGIHRTHYVKSWLSTGYGKTGNKQWGVDVFDKFSPATMQCKRVEKFTLPNLDAELKKLLGYPRPISIHFIVISLNETDRNVQDFILSHNTKLGFDELHGWPEAKVPADRLPMLIEINWRTLKGFLIRDPLVAFKWGVLPFDSPYRNLNRCDVNQLERAVRTRNCVIPLGGIPKKPHVAEAINRITDTLYMRRIEQIGMTNMVHASTVNGMINFAREIEHTLAMADRFYWARGAVYSMDSVSRNTALAELDQVAEYYARIDAVKYLWRLYGAVRELAHSLDDTDYYFHKDVELVDAYDQPFSVENTKERYYQFVEDEHDEYRPQLSRFKLKREATFVTHELSRVRGILIP
jgi:hypothetical protein